mmetsp:Transcript_19093/g.73465  ORF Transcript_19093/g.73465 Transcript_19093/m.73465 type:complete len:212 (-) Transcript_19093:701-1336(-)
MGVRTKAGHGWGVATYLLYTAKKLEIFSANTSEQRWRPLARDWPMSPPTRPAKNHMLSTASPRSVRRSTWTTKSRKEVKRPSEQAEMPCVAQLGRRSTCIRPQRRMKLCSGWRRRPVASMNCASAITTATKTTQSKATLRSSHRRSRPLVSSAGSWKLARPVSQPTLAGARGAVFLRLSGKRRACFLTRNHRCLQKRRRPGEEASRASRPG